jgi:hypothetical protein
MDKKITLHDVMKHSKLIKKVKIYDAFELNVRPWTVLQMQKIMPFISRLTKEYKGLNLKFDEIREKKVIELISDFLPIIEKSKELSDEILDFVYISLEMANETIVVEMDGKREEMPFFTKDEMIKYLLAPDLIAIIAAMFEVNFSKNPSTAGAATVDLVTDPA